MMSGCPFGGFSSLSVGWSCAINIKPQPHIFSSLHGLIASQISRTKMADLPSHLLPHKCSAFRHKLCPGPVPPPKFPTRQAISATVGPIPLSIGESRGLRRRGANLAGKSSKSEHRKTFNIYEIITE
jgi:hypothetical protein